METKKSKTQMVKDHLIKNGSINALESINLYEHPRVHDTIHRLIKRGWIIEKSNVHLTEKSGRIGLYTKYTFKGMDIK